MHTERKAISDEIPTTSPLDISPRTLVVDLMGPEFEMYVSRPNPDDVIYGTIWRLHLKNLNW